MNDPLISGRESINSLPTPSINNLSTNLNDKIASIENIFFDREKVIVIDYLGYFSEIEPKKYKMKRFLYFICCCQKRKFLESRPRIVAYAIYELALGKKTSDKSREMLCDKLERFQQKVRQQGDKDYIQHLINLAKAAPLNADESILKSSLINTPASHVDGHILKDEEQSSTKDLSEENY